MDLEIDSPRHHAWLSEETDRLLAFYRRGCVDPAGGFWWLSADGRPMPEQHKPLWLTARFVHCFAIAHVLGKPGYRPLVEHGLGSLRQQFADPEYGGWYWIAGNAGPVDPRKQTYGHAFVLLAASTALQAGFDTSGLLENVDAVLDRHFLEPAVGLYVDEWDRTWTRCTPYRGQNANMHMTEALMAQAEATGDQRCLDRATRIAEEIIGRHAAANGWQVPEHYDTAWTPLPEFGAENKLGDLMRPYGSLVGHWMEWSRLLIQLRALRGDDVNWMLDAARALFDRATALGWDDDVGGFVFSVGTDGRPVVRARHHWVIAEAIGAATYLYRATGDAGYARWYSAFWQHVRRCVADSQGSWRHELTPENVPDAQTWKGSPDLYHAFQATLYAKTPISKGLVAAARAEHGR